MPSDLFPYQRIVSVSRSLSVTNPVNVSSSLIYEMVNSSILSLEILCIKITGFGCMKCTETYMPETCIFQVLPFE